MTRFYAYHRYNHRLYRAWPWFESIPKTIPRNVDFTRVGESWEFSYLKNTLKKGFVKRGFLKPGDWFLEDTGYGTFLARSNTIFLRDWSMADRSFEEPAWRPFLVLAQENL